MFLSKYCASGNDFLIFASFVKEDRSKLAIKLCNRFYGIGADGLVVLMPLDESEKKEHGNVAYKWDFYNSDGSRANMCGNASRAVSLYAFHNNIASKSHSFLSGAGVIDISIEEIVSTKEAFIKSRLGSFDIKGEFIESYGSREYSFSLVNMTIPHLVCFVSKDEYMVLINDLAFLSSLRHKYNANVNISYKDSNRIYYATFERGVENITQACGTGASAVYAISGDLSKEGVLIPPSKEILKISYKDNAIYCSGLAQRICDCVVD